MNTVKNKFSYAVTSRLGTLVSDPLGEADFKMEWERKDDEELDYELTLPSKIKFRGPSQVYQHLLKLEQSIYRCESVSIAVRRMCTNTGSEVWVDWFNGSFSLNEGDWDLDRCEVSVKLDDAGVSLCITENDGEEIDLMALISTRYLVKTTPPGVTIKKEFASKSGSSTSGPIYTIYWNPLSPYGPDPSAAGFVPYKNNYTNNGTTWNTFTQWARMEITTGCFDSPPGTDWTLWQNNCLGGFGNRLWIKPVSLYDCQYTFPYPTAPGQPQPEGEVMDCKIMGDATQITHLKNGMHLKDVLQAFITFMCPGKTVVSNFFQINPDVVSNINYVTGQRSQTKNIIVFQKSDVKRPTASSATKAISSFDKFIESLTLAFNCKWRIIGNTFRIEHVSYFTQTAGLNLTQGVFSKYTNQMRRYSYETQDIPQREEFKWMETSPNIGDFQGSPITYNGGCVSKDSKKNVKKYQAEIVTTDVQLCISNPDPDSKVVADDGFVLVAADYNGTDYWIMTENSIISAVQELNNTMAWAQLHYHYHRHNRPLSKGVMNETPTNFLSVIPTKKGGKIKVPLCCGTSFNPDNYVITPLGNGVVDKASFSFKDEMLELDLLYNADTGLVQNTAPVAGNDVKKLYVNQTVFINVLANDTDPNGPITSVEIVTPPMHGTAVVMPDKTIRYQPSNGYVGDDYINYLVRDEWNEPSNVALVAITVFAANTAPVAVDDNYTMVMGTTLSVPAPGVLANDHDDVGLVIDSYDNGSVAGGTVVLNPNGSFTYTPITTGFYGTDTFTYTIKDDQGLTDTATVHITITNPNFPIAVDDYRQTLINTTYNFTFPPGILANDINPIAGTLTATAVGIVTPHGGATVNADGTGSYTPFSGFIGRDHYNYTVNNSAGSDVGTVFIDVLPIIYVKIRMDNLHNQVVNNVCNGATSPGGNVLSADFILNFYSDSAGTIPYDVTGLNFRIFIKQGNRATPGGAYDYVTYELEEVSGSEFVFQPQAQYKIDMHDCDGNTTVYYDVTFALDTGLYTII